jgi:hypothetical protein
MLASFLKTTDVVIDKPLSSTAIRKMWVSHMELQGKGDEEKNNLTLLMKHSRATAERWYNMNEPQSRERSADESFRATICYCLSAPALCLWVLYRLPCCSTDGRHLRRKLLRRCSDA